MPDDEHLLRLKADGSEAQRELEETRQDVERLDEAIDRSSQHQQAASKATTDGLDDQGKAARRATDGLDELADGFGTSESEANAFKEVLGRVSPELAGLIDLGTKGSDTFKFLFSPAGLGVAGGIAAFGALNAQIQKSIELTERLIAANERLTQVYADREAALAGELAARGTGSAEALTSATGMAGLYEARGFDPDAVRNVIGAAVDSSGGLRVPREVLPQLIAGVQTGRLTIEGQTEEEIVGSLREALAGIDQEPEAFANAVKAIQEAQRRRAQRAERGDVPELARLLQQVEGLDAESAETAARDLKELIQQGGLEAAGSVGTLGFVDWIKNNSLVYRAFGGQTGKDREEMAQKRLDLIRPVIEQMLNPPDIPTVPSAPPQPAVHRRPIGGRPVPAEGGIPDTGWTDEQRRRWATEHIPEYDEDRSGSISDLEWAIYNLRKEVMSARSTPADFSFEEYFKQRTGVTLNEARQRDRGVTVVNHGIVNMQGGRNRPVRRRVP